MKLVVACLLLAACGNDRQAVQVGPDAAMVVPPDAAPTTLTESTLTLELALGSGSGSAAGLTTLEITARDGTTPVVTDLWLYQQDETGQLAELSGFTSTAARKAPGLMLPATIAGHPSGLSPADDGRANGVMTNTSRGILEQGAFVSQVTGTVVVTLATTPTMPIVVVAGVEDQRYAGAAAINADGTPAMAPAGVGMPETHMLRSFTRDVVPILLDQCGACHRPAGPANADFYLVTGSREDLVNDNFAIAEGSLACEQMYGQGTVPLAQCIQAISKAQYLVEPGAPAVSDLLQRARPDENGSTSPQGLLWYGSKGSRWNADYGDRRMPSTTQSTVPADWIDLPTPLDMDATQFQVLYDWVAQGARP